jgi:hypothetical protein
VDGGERGWGQGLLRESVTAVSFLLFLLLRFLPGPPTRNR